MWILSYITFISIEDSLIAVIAKSDFLLIATYVDNQFDMILCLVTFFQLLEQQPTKKIDLQADD